MKEVVAEINQSVWDLAIQEYGHSNGVVFLMEDNPGVFDFQNQVAAGTKFMVDDSKIIVGAVVTYLKNKGIKPATAVIRKTDGFSAGFSLGFK